MNPLHGLLRWIASLVVRGPGAPVVLGDLEETLRRDLARGVPRWRASVRYVSNLLRSAASLRRDAARRWKDGLSLPGISLLDVKLGVRMLAKYPGLTVIGGIGLAVGVAVSVGSFSVFSVYVYPTLPLDEGDRIVALENRDVERNDEDRRALHDFMTWRDELRTIQDLGAFRTVRRNLIRVDGPPELVQVAEMTASGFHVARVPPRSGRYLQEADERPGAPPVLVIGHDVWQTRFGGEPGVVGETVRLGATTHTIVGVMPEGFRFPESHQYWTPLKASPSAYPPRAGPEIFVFGRLAPGVTMGQAQAELSTIGRRTSAALPETHAQLRPTVMPYTHSLTDVMDVTLWEVGMTQLTMTLLLLVVAANVAVLFYARTATRRGDIAVRSALGASRGRIVAQLFVEALVLSSLAAVAGLLLAHVGAELGFGILEAEMDGGTPFWMDYGLRPTTVLFTMGLAILTAVIVGVVPAFQATGRKLQSDLRELGGGTGLRLGRTWTALIVAQVAIAVAVLPAVVSTAWSDVSEWNNRPTYPVEEFVVAGLWADAEQPGDAPFGDRLTEVIRRVEGEPDVVGVTFRANLPDRAGRIAVEGGSGAPSPSGYEVRSIGGGSDQLELFGARVLTGRGLEPTDAGEDAGGVVVNRAFVEKVLGGGTAVGRRLRHLLPSQARSGAEPERWLPIVGVVENLETNRLKPDTVPPAVYYAVGADRVQEAQVVVRTRGAVPDGLAARIRELTVAVDPTLRLGTVRPMADMMRQERIATRLYGLAVALVLLSVFLLSAAGVYALMSFAVTQRRREIGIRSALGAPPGRVLLSVFARAGRQIALGVVLGLAGATALDVLTDGRILGGQGEILIPTFAVTMALVALLAASGPARRSLGIEPTEALRADV